MQNKFNSITSGCTRNVLTQSFMIQSVLASGEPQGVIFKINDESFFSCFKPSTKGTLLLMVGSKGVKEKIIESTSKLYLKSITANSGLSRLTYYEKLVNRRGGLLY